jgi:eukaryotic-like serine/threonine-protein kinase
MGQVYLAEDTRIDRPVAIKVIQTEMNPYPDDEATRDAVRLFHREAQTIAKLNHPHILPLFDFDSALNCTSRGGKICV